MDKKSRNRGDEAASLPAIETRPLVDADMDQVRRLLDESMGRGLWGLKTGETEFHLVAVLDGVIVGIASTSILGDTSEILPLPAPVCLVRVVAVDPALRGRGLATRLVREVCAPAERNGVASFLSFAWVYASTNRAPLAGTLERLGFRRERRLEGFYASPSSGPCPGCAATPCVCAADVYWRRAGEGVA